MTIQIWRHACDTDFKEFLMIKPQISNKQRRRLRR